MDKIYIQGGRSLKGQIQIAGAKNAILPLMTASILTDKPLILSNIPNLADINFLSHILKDLGVEVTFSENPSSSLTSSAQEFIPGKTLTLCAKNITNFKASYDLVRKMRASILILGPLLARTGNAIVSLPGGCAIGTRPIDIHLKGLEQLGAEISLDHGYIHAKAPHGLKGTDFTFPIITVTGTENLLMAACLAKGTTRLFNVAREPEISDLAKCLVSMGASIDGIGTDTLIIEGKDSLKGTHYRPIVDRIELGTYAIAAAITKGELELLGGQKSLIPTFLSKFEETGIVVEERPNSIFVSGRDVSLKGVDISTGPFPGFATDLQAQMMALLCLSEGSSLITETIWENRFMHVPELMRMGAQLSSHGKSVMVRGVQRLIGAEVMATDLRASFSLVLAGLAAEGETVLHRVYHLDRGYEYVEAKLRACGAQIERIHT